MNDVVKFLKENPVQYLATVGLDGKAKNRPFMFLFESYSVYRYDERSKHNFNVFIISIAFYCFICKNAEEVVQDLEGMQTMRTLGKNMAWILKCIECGKRAGIELPKKEEVIMTNFIR
ncbi:MAG: hypothetical protein SPJ62_07475 [Inconstantimicrobium porci]|uniref:hypothetical protein n=1 Tax=Inconstantimicrobium porci TaxID=2652291 RepID=UPI002A912804|nr:hypothetical protein [Inconstantimicrobium porci]MDY5911831.1 hypothetical protein [Inconstantimicrobium porci]